MAWLPMHSIEQSIHTEIYNLESISRPNWFSIYYQHHEIVLDEMFQAWVKVKLI